MSRGFWSEDCPVRGGGLKHAHWEKCDPASVHPHDASGNEGNQHSYDMCCECEMSEAMYQSADIVMQEQGIRPSAAPDIRGIADHKYVFTIAGRCAKCNRTEDIHPIYRVKAADGCIVDHDSIASILIAVNGKTERTRCPSCLVMVEPHATTGTPFGPPYGRGRGFMTQRHKNELLEVKRKAAFYDQMDA